MQVVDVSDRRVGEVEKVRIGFGFLVRRDGEGTSVWLPQAAIFNVDRGRVSLVCNRAQLDEYKLEEPRD